MSKDDNYIVKIENLSYAHRDKEIFNGVSLSIRRGSVTAIMGPSGTGKSTLLNLIGGQIFPSQGRVMINGANIPDLSRKQLVKMRRQIGLLYQDGALFTDLNVFENVAFLLREHTNLSESMIRDLVLLKLEAVGLRGAYRLMVNQLSGGMARRVALARAIMLDPELMMYDEPLAGQDPINRAVLMKLIRELNDSLGISSIIVSHDVKEVAAIADYVYVIADRQVIGGGIPADVLNEETPKLRQFVQGLPDGPIPFQYPAPNLKEDFSL